MAVRVFTLDDGLIPEDLIQSGLDHLTAARALFDTDPSHYDSAGYLAHIGVELLLKSWLLHTADGFEGTHNLQKLYQTLVEEQNAPPLNESQMETLQVLDHYESLRYPDRNQPTEVGEDDWQEIEALVGFMCRSMPTAVIEALGKIEFGQKAGRKLMRKKITGTSEKN